MQDLIVGERYYFKHGEGCWEGYVTVDKCGKTFIDVSDIEVTTPGGAIFGLNTDRVLAFTAKLEENE